MESFEAEIGEEDMDRFVAKMDQKNVNVKDLIGYIYQSGEKNTPHGHNMNTSISVLYFYTKLLDFIDFLREIK